MSRFETPPFVPISSSSLSSREQLAQQQESRLQNDAVSSMTSLGKDQIPMHLLSIVQILPDRYVGQPRGITMETVLIFHLFLAYFCLVGDYYSWQPFSPALDHFTRIYPRLTESSARALINNIAQVAVSIFTWLIIAHPIIENPIRELLLVGLLASLIDLSNHFVETKSFRPPVPGAPLNPTPSRFFLHDSFNLLVLNISLYYVLAMSWACNSQYHACRCALIFFIVWFMYHMRQAYRRGIWFGSLFRTPPIDYSLCISIIFVTPIMIRNVAIAAFTSSLRLP